MKPVKSLGKITAAFQKVTYVGKINAGKHAGEKLKRCAFKCIDEKSTYFEKTIFMNIHDSDNLDSTGKVKHDAHYVVKNNSIPGNVFENLELMIDEIVPNYEQKIKTFINHYNLDVKLIRNLNDEK